MKRKLILQRFPLVLLSMVIVLQSSNISAQEHLDYMPCRVGWHEAVWDQNLKLVPWTTWDDALDREMRWYLNAPIDPHGYPQFVFATFMDENYQSYRTDIIAGTQDGMGILSYLKYWRYKHKSDPKVLKFAKKMGDYLVNDAATPDKGAYPHFTRSTGDHTDFPIVRSSQGDAKYGANVIEPDKGGIAGFALVRLCKETGDERYLKQAVHNADVLARNMRKGDATHSPWPFRADAITGEYWGERSGDMVYILRLFDELIDMGKTRFREPRDRLWHWIKTYQFTAPDDRERNLWIDFFEDQTRPNNRTSWAPLNMARYLIEKREALDPDWKHDAEKCIQFAIRNFGIERPGDVLLMGEQDVDPRAWGGACSTLGGVAAMFYAAGGGQQYYDMAFRDLSWVTYFIRDDGIPCDQTGMWERLREGGWQEDCHLDVLHNFMDAIAAIPRFAWQRRLVLKPPKHAGVYVIAHRGAHIGIPENTLPAYEKAIQLGVDFVEIDVRMTKDRHFVSVHNNEINKYVLDNNPGKVSEMTLAELKALDVGSRISREWKGTRIPTFEEILDLCRGKCGIYLDLKSAPVAPLIEEIKKRRMEEDVVWCLGDLGELERVHALCPECILMPDPQSKGWLRSVLRCYKPYVVAPVWRDFSKELVEMSHAADAMVFVDERDQNSWTQALEWRADGIQTDHPRELIEFVENRKLKVW